MNVFVQIFQSVIEGIFSITNDYGLAIVLMTLAVRLILLPLNVRQRKQMVQQQKIRQKADAIRSRYKRNPWMAEEELQKLYRENTSGIGSCLLQIVQIPVMICLYYAIRNTGSEECVTILLPWVSSLLVKDQSLILPLMTLAVQVLPMIYPYLRFFASLELQKQPPIMIIVVLFVNGLFVFAIPAGVGLYYLTSGIFQIVTQTAEYLVMIRRGKLQRHNAAE